MELQKMQALASKKGLSVRSMNGTLKALAPLFKDTDCLLTTCDFNGEYCVLAVSTDKICVATMCMLKKPSVKTIKTSSISDFDKIKKFFSFSATLEIWQNHSKKTVLTRLSNNDLDAILNII